MYDYERIYRERRNKILIAQICLGAAILGLVVFALIVR
jgi:hypothetical protein